MIDHLTLQAPTLSPIAQRCCVDIDLYYIYQHTKANLNSLSFEIKSSSRQGIQTADNWSSSGGCSVNTLIMWKFRFSPVLLIISSVFSPISLSYLPDFFPIVRIRPCHGRLKGSVTFFTHFFCTCIVVMSFCFLYIVFLVF